MCGWISASRCHWYDNHTAVVTVVVVMVMRYFSLKDSKKKQAESIAIIFADWIIAIARKIHRTIIVSQMYEIIVYTIYFNPFASLHPSTFRIHIESTGHRPVLPFPIITMAIVYFIYLLFLSLSHTHTHAHTFILSISFYYHVCRKIGFRF